MARQQIRKGCEVTHIYLLAQIFTGETEAVAAHDVTAALVAEVRGTFGANGSDELQQLELVASFSSDYRRAADHIRYILFRLPSKLYLLVRSSLALITNLNGRQCCIQVIKASPFLTAFATPHRFLPLPPPWAVSST